MKPLNPPYNCALRDAGRAHADLEGRRTRGPVVVLPEG